MAHFYNTVLCPKVKVGWFMEIFVVLCRQYHCAISEIFQISVLFILVVVAYGKL